MAGPPEDWTDLPLDGPARPEVALEPADHTVDVLHARRQGFFRRLFAGRFGRLLLPAIVAQSILVGGGYATGREVVEFGARFGSLGWIAALTIFVGFSVVSILVFEFARVVQAYDYHTFVRGLIGPGSPLFDLLFAAMAILVIAVMASAAGAIIESTVGVPALVGILVVVASVAALTYHGTDVIEAFKTLGTTLLYVGYLTFGVVVLMQGWPQVVEVFSSGDTTHAAGAGTSAAIGQGVLYVGYNLSIYPAVLFTLHRQRRTRDSVVAGIVAGFTMTLPFVVTYLCVLAFYSGDAVVGAAVPWLPMLEASAGPWVVALFGLVVGWTLLETSVGLVHAILDRVDRSLRRPLARWHRAGLATFALLGAAVLAQAGVIGLVAGGYTAMGYGFLALFALPLFTVGLWRIVRAHRRPAHRPTVADAGVGA